jgi:hypothetical protein
MQIILSEIKPHWRALKAKEKVRRGCLMPVILATQKAEIRRITV